MNKNVATVFAFLFGLGVGAGSAYIYTKNKYEGLIEEEVSSARETYQRLAKELADKNEEEKKKMFTEYVEHVETYTAEAPVGETIKPQGEETVKLGTIDIKHGQTPNIEENIVKELKPDDISIKNERLNQNTPYEIDANEYGSIEEYNLVSLNYYSNEVITNDEEDVLEDPAVMIGQKLLDKLPIYENNGIYIAYARNDVRRCDYEIVLTGYDYEE